MAPTSGVVGRQAHPIPKWRRALLAGVATRRGQPANLILVESLNMSQMTPESWLLFPETR